MKKLFRLGLIFFLTYAASVMAAYEMHGTMNDNNDGTYSVQIKSNTGYEYLGTAVKQGDGTLNVNVAVQGGGSEVYLGTAEPAGGDEGTYHISLHNNTTGDLAVGTLTEN